MNAPARVRRDPRENIAARARPAAATGQVSATIRVDEPACFVLAALDLEAGRLSRADREVMAAARQLADALGGAVVLFAGHAPDAAIRADLAAEGADRSAVVTDAAFASDLAESRLPFVLGAMQAVAARHAVFPETAIGGELARRVASRLGERPATHALRVSATEVTVAFNAGRLDMVRPLPRILLPQAGAFAPLPPGQRREARPIPVAWPTAATPRARVAATLPLDPGAVPLAEAALIISAGAGVTDWESFHAAAAALGAATGGSRVVCDAGLLPRDRQVGVSGVLVAPRCYLAFGIAGASQHLHGIEAAERVVAVNADPRAEMLHRADLAIVADAQAVLPALARRAQARQAADGS